MGYSAARAPRLLARRICHRSLFPAILGEESFRLPAAVVCAYALLGCCWLVLKTGGALNRRARRWGRRLWVGALFGVVGVSLWTPIAEPAVAQRWLTWPTPWLLAPVAFLAIISAFALERSLRRGADAAPFLWCVAFYLLVLASLAISVWPYIVPWRATLWEVASPPRTQLFVLVGVAFILPLVLGYTANAYYVFRGKVSEVERY